MGVLSRKLARDLFRARWQYASVAVMVVCGVAFMIGAYSVYANLRASYDTSYERLDFEDFGIAFHGAPKRAAERIRRIEGVKAVEGRHVEDVIVEIPGRATKKLIGRLISVPPNREATVDRLRLVAGSPIRSATAREVLIEAAFAQHNELGPGDHLEVVRGTARANLRIVGVVQSPEYLYVVRSKQDILPAPDTFGVMFVSEDVLGPLVGKTGQINEIRATVVDKARLAAIAAQAKRALAVYDPEEPVPRSEQPSWQLLEQDVRGFQSYAVLFPLLFLSVAALAVGTLLNRVVHQERPVIGLLRSLGYSSGAVVRHYLAGAAAIGVVSSVAGAALGLWFGGVLSRLYMSQLQVPFELIEPRWPLAAVGILIGAGTCAMAAIAPARRAAAIRPAEAMRPLTPSFGSRSIRLDALVPGLPLLARLPLRNLFRQPRRTITTLVGIVAAFCLLILARGLLDSMEVALGNMLRDGYRYDLQASFIERVSHNVAARVQTWPGVGAVEASLDVPVVLEHAGRTYDSVVIGLEPNSRLRPLRNAAGDPVGLSSQGAIFGPTLRKRLRLERGDLVKVTLVEGLTPEKSTPRWVRVAGFNDEAIGTQAYMPIAEVRRLFRKDLSLPPNAISSLMIRADRAYEGELRGRLLETPHVATVISITEMRDMMNQLMSAMRRFVLIMEAFGVMLAFAMIFNMVTINVLERASEVATLRTIGVDTRQIAAMVVAENMLVVLMGTLIGLPFGRVFIAGFWHAAQTEEQQDLFAFNVTVFPATYFIATAFVLAAALVSQIPSLRYLARLDLARASKERAT